MRQSERSSRGRYEGASRRWGGCAAFALLFALGCQRPSPTLEDRQTAAPADERPRDPLSSWNDGETKRAIVSFVERVTREGSPEYVSVPERIAVFDNDGTLWCEQPIYVQAAFMVDRVKTLSPDHPEWKDKEPFKSVLAGNMSLVAQQGEKALADLLKETHAGMTPDEFARIVSDWLKTARHPRYGRPYTELAYAPMVELLGYLRDNGFKTFIVSGGGVEFMRPWTEAVYGVPPEQVVGSSGKLRFEMHEGTPVLVRLPEVDFIDDKSGKPVGIEKFIGRRPIAAFGNSDGDKQMLEYTAAGAGPRLLLLVHHTDAEREYAYDRRSPIGRLGAALDEARSRGWLIADMKKDFRIMFSTPGT